MNNQTKQTNADYKQIMNSKSVQGMKELIVSQKVKINNQIQLKEEIKLYEWKNSVIGKLERG